MEEEVYREGERKKKEKEEEREEEREEHEHKWFVCWKKIKQLLKDKIE